VIAVNTNAINYGILNSSPGPQVQTVTVTNNGGTENLTISSTPIAGAPEFNVTSTPGPIAPGASAPVEITFTPGSGFGRFNATLQILSNDSEGTTPSITLTAFVNPSGTVAARFDFSPHSVSGTVVDIDTTTLAAVVLGSLTDKATGNSPPLSPFPVPPMTPPAKSKFLSDGSAGLPATRRDHPRSDRGLGLTSSYRPGLSAYGQYEARDILKPRRDACFEMGGGGGLRFEIGGEGCGRAYGWGD
jgi:hypothetical protein